MYPRRYLNRLNKSFSKFIINKYNTKFIINTGGPSRADLLEQSADLSEAVQYYSRRIEFALQDAQRQMDLLRLRLRMG